MKSNIFYILNSNLIGKTLFLFVSHTGSRQEKSIIYFWILFVYSIPYSFIYIIVICFLKRIVVSDKKQLINIKVKTSSCGTPRREFDRVCATLRSHSFDMHIKHRILLLCRYSISNQVKYSRKALFYKCVAVIIDFESAVMFTPIFVFKFDCGSVSLCI